MLPTCVWWFDSILATLYVPLRGVIHISTTCSIAKQLSISRIIMVETMTWAKEKNMKLNKSKLLKWCKGKPKRKTTGERKVQCNKCGIETRICLFHKKDMLCEDCFYEVVPPKTTLVEFVTSQGRLIWNVAQSVYETEMKVADFEKCGWFVRQIRKNTSYIYYDLEYCGKFKCKRCGDYIFPTRMPRCPEESKCLNQTSDETARVYH